MPCALPLWVWKAKRRIHGPLSHSKEDAITGLGLLSLVKENQKDSVSFKYMTLISTKTKKHKEGLTDKLKGHDVILTKTP